jgi:hypothetical protein
VVDVRPARPATMPPQPATPPPIRHWHALHPAAARAADPARAHPPQALDRLFCHGEARHPPLSDFTSTVPPAPLLLEDRHLPAGWRK